jgi:CheY-like chemotaxis protein
MPRHHEEKRPVEAAQKAVAIASHEIRGSLAAIVAHAELVVDGELTPDRQDEVTRLIARNGRSLLALLDDVLFASRIDAGAEQPHPAPCCVREMLEDLVDLHASEADARGLFLELDVDHAVPARVMIDAVHLRRILVNLATNAIKFTEQGGVRIRVDHEASRYLVISVEDTGVGLQERDLDRIFEPFVQSSERDRTTPGSGLGLAITRELVSLLGGTVAATSRPGSGSTFTITVPATGCTITPGTPALDGIRVLCADDCADSRMILGHHLAAAGAEVMFVNDGQTLVDRLRDPACRSGHDVVLVDLEMPGIGGLEAAALLRSAGCALPIITLSAHAPQQIVEQARRHGCDASLAKPVDPDELSLRIQRVLSCTELPRTG